MRTLIPFKGKSQYDKTIGAKLRNSACGPVTAAAILEYHEELPIGIDFFYRALGTTPIGLFKWRLLRRLRKLLGPRFEVIELRSLDKAKQEIKAGRPVAMKFDKYFSFHWFDKPSYNYHWVPLIGFEDQDDDILLFIHDNGGRNRPSKLRTVSWKQNRHVLSFVAIRPSAKR